MGIEGEMISLEPKFPTGSALIHLGFCFCCLLIRFLSMNHSLVLTHTHTTHTTHTHTHTHTHHTHTHTHTPHTVQTHTQPSIAPIVYPEKVRGD